MSEILSLRDAVAGLVRPGDTIALEGFTHLIPFAAGHEVIRQGIGELTLIRMTPDLLYDQMIGSGLAKRLIFSWGGNPGVGSLHRLRDAVERGWPRPLEIEEHSHAAMAQAYAAGAANPLVGEWNVTGYNNGKQAVVSPVAGTTLTATFTESEVSGSSGCNTFTGSYTLDGDKLTVGPLASTMKACVDDAVMDQEAQFLTALQTPTTVELNGATVTLRANSGETQVVLAPQ